MSYKIQLLKNKKPEIEKIDFNCDVPIHKKLNVWPMVRDNLNKPNTTVICGRQGSGKTNLLVNIIKKVYKKCFHKIYVFMPESSRNSMKDKIFDKLPPEQLFEELNLETLSNLHNQMKQDALKGMWTLIIYDDVQKSLKNYDIMCKLQEMIANQRHIKLVNIFLVQNFMKIEKQIREIINNIIFFKMDKSQTEKIFNDVVEFHKDKFDVIRDLVFDAPYEWLLISKTNQRMYKGFDEIIIVNDDEDPKLLEVNDIEINNNVTEKK